MRTELIATLLCLLFAGPVQAANADEQQRIDDLERRIEELETEKTGARALLPGWTDHVRLGGSTNVGYYDGQSNSPWSDLNFEAWDARFFLDVEFGDSVRAGETTLLRNAGFSFEWNLVRLGKLQNDVGELFVEFQGIADSGWLNLQVGRFQIPVGESYLRYSKGYSKKPFISSTVGGPWWWDEGLKIYGRNRSGVFSYIFSMTEAETGFNTDTNSELQYTLKLIADPLEWLHLSVSGLYNGGIGSPGDAGAGGALWLGETWARAFGSGSSVPSYIDGVEDTGTAPNEIDRTYLVAADAILDFPELGRLWLAYGSYWIEQGQPRYDRQLQYWIAEILLYGSIALPALRDVYLGFRAEGLGTYDADRGYLLDFHYGGSLGYNMKSLNAYTVVLGWKLMRYITLRAEYSHRDIRMVRGVTPELERDATRQDQWGLEVGIHF